jgi:hypothetical protein
LAEDLVTGFSAGFSNFFGADLDLDGLAAFLTTSEAFGATGALALVFSVIAFGAFFSSAFCGAGASFAFEAETDLLLTAGIGFNSFADYDF